MHWPIGRFLALLGDDDDDRARLLHLVRLLRRDRENHYQRLSLTDTSEPSSTTFTLRMKRGEQ